MPTAPSTPPPVAVGAGVGWITSGVAVGSGVGVGSTTSGVGVGSGQSTETALGLGSEGDVDGKIGFNRRVASARQPSRVVQPASSTVAVERSPDVEEHGSGPVGSGGDPR